MGPKVVSLFSGAGGLDLGFVNAGYQIVSALDASRDCVETYRSNISPHVRLLDVSELDAAALPPCDVVIGGPPCQGFSVGGKMDPKDPRSTLVWHFLRLVEGLSPEAFVMENVKALGVLKKWSGVRHSLVQRFESLGYSVSVNILTASHYGVPQARERVFFVGLKGGKGELRLRRQKPTSVRSILETLPPPGQSPNLGACRARIVPAKRPVLRRSPYAGMLFNGQGRPIDLSAACNTLPASMGGNRTPIVDEMELRQGAEPWVVGYHARLISGGMLEAVAPERLRRLSVTEASLLQCFPRGYVFAGSQCSQYRQIGNAVPPPLAQAVAQALLEIL